MKRFRIIYTLVFTLCLTAFTAYAVLDTFVLTRVYAAVEPPVPAAASAETQTQEGEESTGSPHTLSSRHGRGESGENSASTVTETASDPADAWSYEDGAVKITLTEYYEYNSAIYVADVLLKDAASLQTVFAQNSYGKNVTATASQTAAQAGAILAVNGDNYGSREKGYVIRNGVLYRSAAAKDQEDLVIYADGSFEIISESEITAQELLERGAMQVFSFGPGLVENGMVTVSENEEVDRAKASNPRTAIGILGENHLVFVVSDGRTEASEGLSLYELAEFMQSLGAETAYNLDGGGSSTMVFQGTVVNRPTSGGTIKERAVTDIICIL